MKRVRSFDTKTGQFLGVLHAASVTSATRYDKAYKCLDAACSCSFHWRRAVDAKENTEKRAETFAKNPSSSHAPDCRYDFERIAKESNDLAFYKDGKFHLRVLFPIGSSSADRYPMRGDLSMRQVRAAHANVDKVGLSSIRDIVKFIEKRIGTLEDDGLDDLVLYYQGQSLDWEDAWVASDNYSKLIGKAFSKDRLGRSKAGFVVIKPTHEIAPSPKGSRKFVCESQYAQPGYKTLSVKPIVTCETDEVAKIVENAVSLQQPILMAARPFVPETKANVSDPLVYLHAHESRQLSVLSPDYWRPVLGSRHQRDFLDELDVPGRS